MNPEVRVGSVDARVGSVDAGVGSTCVGVNNAEIVVVTAGAWNEQILCGMVDKKCRLYHMVSWPVYCSEY